jgi:hypothetical protein
MNKYPLVGGSICAVVLLVLGSLTNVVGYQTVQSSNQKIIATDNPKDLLFQTIIDFANNKEIQKIFLESCIKNQGLFTSSTKTPLLTFPTLTKKHLDTVYRLGQVLQKMMTKFRLFSMNQGRRFDTQFIIKINSIIAKDKKLNEDMAKLSALDCNCNDNQTYGPYPVICGILCFLYYGDLFPFIFWFMIAYSPIYKYFPGLIFSSVGLWLYIIMVVVVVAGMIYSCNWVYNIPFFPPIP